MLGACARRCRARAVPIAEALGLRGASTRWWPTEAVPPFANTRRGRLRRARRRRRRRVGADARSASQVIGTIRAGAAPDVEPGPGQAVRIMTGAPVPAGRRRRRHGRGRPPVPDDDGVVELFAAVRGRRRTCARPGDDLRPGDLVYPAGDVLTAGHLGRAGHLRRRARCGSCRRPRVGVLSTGDELVDGPAAARSPARSATRTGARCWRWCAQAGADAGRPRAASATTRRPSPTRSRDGVGRCDALLTSGGVSMGDFDFVKVVLDRMGDMRWMQVAIRPAKPLAFGTVDRRRSTACRCSGCPATRCRRWCPSSCSPARRCAR